MMSKTVILSLAAAVAALVAKEGSSVETEGHDNKGALRNKNGMLAAATAGVFAMGAASVAAGTESGSMMDSSENITSSDSSHKGSMSDSFQDSSDASYKGSISDSLQDSSDWSNDKSGSDSSGSGLEWSMNTSEWGSVSDSLSESSESLKSSDSSRF